MAENNNERATRSIPESDNGEGSQEEMDEQSKPGPGISRSGAGYMATSDKSTGLDEDPKNAEQSLPNEFPSEETKRKKSPQRRGAGYVNDGSRRGEEAKFMSNSPGARRAAPIAVGAIDRTSLRIDALDKSKINQEPSVLLQSAIPEDDSPTEELETGSKKMTEKQRQIAVAIMNTSLTTDHSMQDSTGQENPRKNGPSSTTEMDQTIETAKIAARQASDRSQIAYKKGSPPASPKKSSLKAALKTNTTTASTGLGLSASDRAAKRKAQRGGGQATRVGAVAVGPSASASDEPPSLTSVNDRQHGLSAADSSAKQRARNVASDDCTKVEAAPALHTVNSSASAVAGNAPTTENKTKKKKGQGRKTVSASNYSFVLGAAPAAGTSATNDTDADSYGQQSAGKTTPSTELLNTNQTTSNASMAVRKTNGVGLSAANRSAKRKASPKAVYTRVEPAIATKIPAAEGASEGTAAAKANEPEENHEMSTEDDSTKRKAFPSSAYVRVEQCIVGNNPREVPASAQEPGQTSKGASSTHGHGMDQSLCDSEAKTAARAGRGLRKDSSPQRTKKTAEAKNEEDTTATEPSAVLQSNYPHKVRMEPIGDELLPGAYRASVPITDIESQNDAEIVVEEEEERPLASPSDGVRAGSGPSIANVEEADIEVPTVSSDQPDVDGLREGRASDVTEDKSSMYGISTRQSSRRDFLVEATLVESRADLMAMHTMGEIAQAEALDETQMASTFLKSRTGKCSLCAIALLLTGLIVGLTVGRPGSKLNGINRPPTEQGLTPQDILEELRLSSELQSRAVQDSTSPQAKAIAWMMDDKILSERQAYQKLQRYALASFFYSTQGDNWTKLDGWLDHGSQECSWLGVSCDIRDSNFYPRYSDDDDGNLEDAGFNTSTTHIRRITLFNNGLNGTIPFPELSLVSPLLETLDLGANAIHGSITSDVGALTLLKSLQLSRNDISGQIPTEVGKMTSLTVLDVGPNKLSGLLPSEIGLLSNLTYVSIAGNDIMKVPVDVFLCASLESLLLSSNPNLQGTLPTEVGQATSLKFVDITNASLTGTIPMEVGALTKLTNLWIDSNDIKGRIPTEIGLQRGLERLNLGSNQLSGSLPGELVALPGLCELNLTHNALTGSLPRGLGQLCFGRTPEKAGNQSMAFTMKAYAEVDPQFEAPVLDQTHVQIPTKFFRESLPGIQSLEALILSTDVYENSARLALALTARFEPGSSLPTRVEMQEVFTRTGQRYILSWQSVGADGNVTEEAARTSWFSISTFEELVLDLSYNAQTGNIPASLFVPQSFLKELHLKSNLLTGTIPETIAEATGLIQLDLSNNAISGTLPSELGSLPQLTALKLASNFLTGTVPAELQNISRSLEEVDLSNNALSGTLPWYFTDGALQTLDLKGNQFTGTIPSRLSSESLCTLDLAGNALTGSIPPDLSFLCSELRGQTTAEVLNDTSIQLVFGLDITFDSFWDGSEPFEREYDQVVEHISDFFGSVLKQEYNDSFAYINTTRLHKSFDEEARVPVSLVLAAAVEFASEDDLPMPPSLLETLKSADLEEFLYKYLWESFGSVFYDADSVVLKLGSDTLYLDLSNNSLSGTVPIELVDLLSVKTSFVNLLGNPLTGTLPKQFCPWLCGKGSEPANNQTLLVDCEKVQCDCGC